MKRHHIKNALIPTNRPKQTHIHKTTTPPNKTHQVDAKPFRLKVKSGGFVLPDGVALTGVTQEVSGWVGTITPKQKRFSRVDSHAREGKSAFLPSFFWGPCALCGLACVHSSLPLPLPPPHT